MTGVCRVPRFRASGIRALCAILREIQRKGTEVVWLEQINHDEASAVQHAMNLKLQDKAMFYAEYQNEPLTGRGIEDEGLLTADQISGKLNGMKRGEVPIGANHLAMFIDVHGTPLF